MVLYWVYSEVILEWRARTLVLTASFPLPLFTAVTDSEQILSIIEAAKTLFCVKVGVSDVILASSIVDSVAAASVHQCKRRAVSVGLNLRFPGQQCSAIHNWMANTGASRQTGIFQGVLTCLDGHAEGEGWGGTGRGGRWKDIKGKES